MRKLIVALFVFVAGLGAVQARHAHGQRLGTPVQTNFNLITDGGAVCNGIADDALALANVGAKIRAAQVMGPGTPVTLTVPSGSHCQLLSCPASTIDGIRAPLVNVTNFTLIATGAQVFGNGSMCQKWSQDIIGSDGQAPVVQHKFVANSIGDVCVTMVNSGDETNYPIGQWVVVAGQGMQVNSYPPNYAKWEFAQVNSRPTGKVCFSSPLKNAYVDSTHVVDLLGAGANCSNVTCGGQGTLVLMFPAWGSTYHFIGGTWLLQNELEFPEQTVILDNMIWTGGGQNCYTPSLTQKVTYNNNNAGTCTSEDDKEVDQIVVNGGTLNTNFQSSSINSITLNSGAVLQTVGSPVTINCNNSTISSAALVHFGNSFGNPQYNFNGVNCTFVDFSVNGAFANFVTALPSTGTMGQFSYDGAGHFVSTSDDIFAGNPFYPTWIQRGGKMRFSCCTGSAVDYDNEITIGDSQFSPLTSSTGTMTISVSPSPGANLPAPNSGTLGYGVNVFPIITCSGCVGTANATSTGRMAADFNAAPAQNATAFTYSKRTYTCANNLANVAGSYDINVTDHATIGGTLTSLKVNVTTADTNPSDASATIASVPAINFNPTTGVETSHPTTYATVDLLHTGLRTVTPAGTSGSVGADSLNSPGGSSVVPTSQANITNFSLTGVTNGPAAQCPVASIEWITSN